LEATAYGIGHEVLFSLTVLDNILYETFPFIDIIGIDPRSIPHRDSITPVASTWAPPIGI
jgi:hypothetical protein